MNPETPEAERMNACIEYCDICKKSYEIKQEYHGMCALKKELSARPSAHPTIKIPDPGPIRNIAFEATAEAMGAMENWPPFNSAHEGFAVLKEEVDELWDHVKTNQKKRDIAAMRKECIQVAAMAMRFALEICNETNGRK